MGLRSELVLRGVLGWLTVVSGPGRELEGSHLNSLSCTLMRLYLTSLSKVGNKHFFKVLICSPFLWRNAELKQTVIALSATLSSPGRSLFSDT